MRLRRVWKVPYPTRALPPERTRLAMLVALGADRMDEVAVQELRWNSNFVEGPKNVLSLCLIFGRLYRND